MCDHNQIEANSPRRRPPVVFGAMQIQPPFRCWSLLRRSRRHQWQNIRGCPAGSHSNEKFPGCRPPTYRLSAMLSIWGNYYGVYLIEYSRDRPVSPHVKIVPRSNLIGPSCGRQVLLPPYMPSKHTHLQNPQTGRNFN